MALFWGRRVSVGLASFWRETRRGLGPVLEWEEKRELCCLLRWDGRRERYHLLEWETRHRLGLLLGVET